MKNGIGAEAASYVKEKYGREINTKLDQITTILYDEEVNSELSIDLARLIADISALNFLAGIEFGKLHPEAAERLKQSAARETQLF